MNKVTKKGILFNDWETFYQGSSSEIAFNDKNKARCHFAQLVEKSNVVTPFEMRDNTRYNEYSLIIDNECVNLFYCEVE